MDQINQELGGAYTRFSQKSESLCKIQGILRLLEKAGLRPNTPEILCR